VILAASAACADRGSITDHLVEKNAMSDHLADKVGGSIEPRCHQSGRLTSICRPAPTA
jgi:hypothetical protein